MIAKLKNKVRQWRRKWSLYQQVNWYKTLRFNFKMFPFGTAVKLPVFFYGSVHFSGLSGKLVIDAPVKRAMIGFGQPYEFVSRSKGIAELMLHGTLVCKGHVQFGKDYFIHIAPGAYCEFGHLASIANTGKIICKEKIVLGDYARIGSESQLIDTNFHQMIDTQTGERFPMTAPIYLGDYNFVSNRVSIMQKTVTPNYCTIASNTLCNKDYTEWGENIMIGGIPAKLLRENISRDWKGEQEAMERNLIVR